MTRMSVVASTVSHKIDARLTSDLLLLVVGILNGSQVHRALVGEQESVLFL